tara:strand:+ start:695 stop:1246 length:552 start_codon:yes stop_codon:yes gene_type:complete
MISGCDVSGKIQFTDPPCDCMAKATIAFDATIYGDCCECSGCEPSPCECSGFVELEDYTALARSTGRKWINGSDVKEIVVSGTPPAPGQSAYLSNVAGSQGFDYFGVIKADFWLVDKNGLDFALPIPHHDSTSASGTQTAGTWTIHKEDLAGNTFKVSASSDAMDFSTNDKYVIWGVVEFISI